MEKNSKFQCKLYLRILDDTVSYKTIRYRSQGEVDEQGWSVRIINRDLLLDHQNYTEQIVRTAKLDPWHVLPCKHEDIIEIPSEKLIAEVMHLMQTQIIQVVPYIIEYSLQICT